VKDAEVKLADGLLGSEFDLFFPRKTGDVGRLLAASLLEENGFFEAGDLSVGELGELVIRVLEEFGEKEAGGVHDCGNPDQFMRNDQNNQSMSQFFGM
jgi:hypothetical protein